MFLKKDIEFSTFSNLKNVLAEPHPSNKFIDEWYKKLDKDITKPDAPGFTHKDGVVSTVKRCMPFLDAMTSGYIIPAPVDMHIKRNENDINGNVQLNFYTCLSIEKEPIIKVDHSFEQLKNHPYMLNGNIIVMKFVNPWVIKTPKGYSCLFVNPLNISSPESIEIIPGIVETDRYHSNINFPFFYHSKENTDTFIKKGTPLVHVIPFKRESWFRKISFFNEKNIINKKSIDARIRSTFVDGYRDLFWVKKNFK